MNNIFYKGINKNSWSYGFKFYEHGLAEPLQTIKIVYN